MLEKKSRELSALVYLTNVPHLTRLIIPPNPFKLFSYISLTYLTNTAYPTYFCPKIDYLFSMLTINLTVCHILNERVSVKPSLKLITLQTRAESKQEKMSQNSPPLLLQKVVERLEDEKKIAVYRAPTKGDHKLKTNV